MLLYVSCYLICITGRIDMFYMLDGKSRITAFKSFFMPTRAVTMCMSMRDVIMIARIRVRVV